MVHMTDSEYIDNQETLANRASTHLDRAMAEGHPFSEVLCDWASRKAERELGSPSSDDFGHPNAASLEDTAPARDVEKESFC